MREEDLEKLLGKDLLLKLRGHNTLLEKDPLYMVDGYPLEKLNEMVQYGVIKTTDQCTDLIDSLHMVHKYPPKAQTKEKNVSQIIMSNPIYFLNTGEGWAGNMELPEFQTWYFIENPQADLDTFYDLLKKLESGEVAHISNGMTIQKHKVFDEIDLPALPTDEETECKHEETFINHAGGTKFKQCKLCKADLGDI